MGSRGRDWVGVSADDVAWVRLDNGMTLIVCRDSQELMVEDSLQALHDKLGPRFFRANRWALVGLDSVARVRRLGRGRLGLVLEPPSESDVEVPQEKAAEFRAWFGIQ